MAPPTIVLTFDNNEVGVFFPGQTITGRVLVNNDKQRNCNGISLTFEGNAIVRFSETKQTSNSRGGTTTNTVTYVATEEYYKSKFLLWSDISQQMAAGSFSFPFTFTLPPNTPASFQCQFGQVEHFCQANVKLPMARDSYCKRPYSVNSLLDLNLDPANRVAQNRQDYKTLCCLCCRSGPITAQVHLNKLGYVPGEPISVSAEINNSSNRKITETKAELYMNVQLIAVGRTKQEQYRLLSLTQPEVPVGGECVWSGHSLLIPPLPASGLMGCNIINVTYNLRFTVSPKLPATSLKLDFPIIIGSIPLRETFQQFAQFQQTTHQLQEANQYSKPSTSGFPESPPDYRQQAFPGLQQYPDMPPPTYSQAVSADMQHFPSAPEATPDQVTATPLPGMSKSAFTPTYVSYTMRGPPTAQLQVM